MGRLNRRMTREERAETEAALELLDRAIDGELDEAELDKAIAIAEKALIQERPI